MKTCIKRCYTACQTDFKDVGLVKTEVLSQKIRKNKKKLITNPSLDVYRKDFLEDGSTLY